MKLNNKLWALFLVSMFALSGSVCAMEVDDATTIGFQEIAGHVSRDDVRDMVSKDTKFEFWNKSDIPLYIKLGNLENQTERYIEVEPHARVVSNDRVNYILFSQIKNPEFAENSSLYVFDPDKKVYVRGKKEKNTYIVSTQTGYLPGVPGAGAILKLGRKAFGEGARGKLGSETESGLSLRGSVSDQDILWLPNPFLPYSDNYPLFNAIRDSGDDAELVKEKISKFSNIAFEQVNRKILRGWTPMHEAALWKDFKVLQKVLSDEYKATSYEDGDGINPTQLFETRDATGVLGLYPAVLATNYIQKLKEYVDDYTQLGKKYVDGVDNEIPELDQLLLKKYLARLAKLVGALSTEYKRNILRPLMQPIYSKVELLMKNYTPRLYHQEIADLKKKVDFDNFFKYFVGNKDDITKENFYNYYYEFLGLERADAFQMPQANILDKIKKRKKELENVGVDEQEIYWLFRQFENAIGTDKKGYDTFIQGEDVFNQLIEKRKPITSDLIQLHRLISDVYTKMD